MCIIINLVSGPGSGKTTIASLLFAKLKLLKKYKVELVQEYAKTLVWQEKYDILNNQHFVSRSQYELFKSIYGKVDIIVTDGSLLHGLFYNRYNNDNLSNVEKTEQHIINWFHEFNNMTVFLERGEFKYEQEGRIQTYEEALEADRCIKDILNEKHIAYVTKRSSVDNIDEILDYVIKYMNSKNEFIIKK